METDFTTIEYLKTGNLRQQLAYAELTRLSVFDDLKRYCPLLTGTIPIGIDLPESDLDIICECSDHAEFRETLCALYSDKEGFRIHTSQQGGKESTVAAFRSGQFDIEVFGQDCPSHNQSAYIHMLVEHKILNSMGEEFRENVLRLKRGGLKTEPAFAQLLGLKGDPYKELLKFEK
ncbi:MAG: DUF4269 domain-containing protein [Bacteroidia bacterium]|nr:DUF4269 domain-containing protein [Bacteroidia bacterium]